MTVLIFSVRVSTHTHHVDRYMVNTVVKIMRQVCVKIIASCSTKHIVSCISFPTLGIKKCLISSKIDKVVCFLIRPWWCQWDCISLIWGQLWPQPQKSAVQTFVKGSQWQESWLKQGAALKEEELKLLVLNREWCKTSLVKSQNSNNCCENELNKMPLLMCQFTNLVLWFALAHCLQLPCNFLQVN